MLSVGIALLVVGLIMMPQAGAAGTPRAKLAATTSGECQLPGQQTFPFRADQKVQTCTVPSGVSSLTVTVIGGQGGTCTDCGAGGQGGEVIATLPVKAGDTVRVWVGQQGQPQGGSGLASGGARGTSPSPNAYNGAGGGGSSAVAIGTSDTAVPLVVAGGGGGGGGNGAAGNLSGAGGPGGAGGNPATNGARGQDSKSGTVYGRGGGGAGGSGGQAGGPDGAQGESNALFSAGGGGGGGLLRGGAGGHSANGGAFGVAVGGGGGGGGGGDSSVQTPAQGLLYTTATTGGSGSVTLSTAQVQTKHCGSGTFPVPANVSQLQVIAVGGQGGTGSHTGQPGFGARVSATITLEGQQKLTYRVGCRGYGIGGYGYGTGGYQGTASGSAYSGEGGGGGTAVLDAPGPLVVAGGGGGPGGRDEPSEYGGNGGNAGYGPGQAGAGSGGDGGSPSRGHGGAGGANGSIDGQSGADSSVGGAGGGGGGGYTPPASGGSPGGGGLQGTNGDPYGGGGGGGGAGASYARQGATSNVTYDVSGNTGDGYLVFIYEPVVPVPSHVRVLNGAGQHAVIGTQFRFGLQVQVTDQLNRPMAGQTVLFVAPGSGASAEFGNGHPYMTATTNATGIATSSYLTANQTAGSFHVLAGGINYQAYTSIPLTNDPSPTTMSNLTSSANPSVVGQPITFSATVQNTLSGPAPPSGKVQFTVDGHDVGSAVPVQPVVNGSPGQSLATSAPLTLSSVGSHTFGASFLGTANYKPSSASPGSQAVLKADTATQVASSANPSAFGQPVTFSATVAPVSPGAGSPTGTVTFKDGTTTIGTGTLSAEKATFTTASLSAGTHPITAVYGGDSNFKGSASTPPLGQVTRPGPAPPTTSITTPSNGATYGQGQVVNSSFSCSEGAGGTGIASCMDQNGNPSGTAIDTSNTGQHTFTVTARSDDGLSSQSSVTYTISSPTAPPTGCQDPTGAFNQGFNAGFSSAFNSGFNSGFNDGFRAGFQTGFTHGFGSTAKHVTTRFLSLAAGRAQAIAAQATYPACDQFFNQGFNTGFNPAFDSGFQKGFNAAFASGFNSGFNAGYNARHQRR